MVDSRIVSCEFNGFKIFESSNKQKIADTVEYNTLENTHEIKTLVDFKENNDSELNNIISEIFGKLNLSTNKAEKDIGIYKSSISKMEQAKELIEELKIKEKRKLEKK